MSKSYLSFSGDVSLFKKFLNKEVWRGNLEREIRKATIRNSLFLIKKIKDNIRNDEFAENASMTLALKRSNKALIDNRNLWNAIDHKLKSSFESEVGILENRASTGSKFGKAKSQMNIKHLVELIESGYTIKVTEKMRKALMASLNEDRTKSGKLKEKSRVALQRAKSAFAGGGTWVVPPRPLFTKVWDDPTINDVIQENWKRALEGAFKAQGAKDGEHKDR